MDVDDVEAALARLNQFMNRYATSSDFDHSQIHSDKLGPEAAKVKKLNDTIRTHAFNHDLPHALREDSTLGPELLDSITQLKGLEISEFSKLMIAAFENILSLLLANVTQMTETEQLVDTKQATVRKNMEMVRKIKVAVE